MSLLFRRCLIEGSGLWLVYAFSYLAVTVVAIAAPLIVRGAAPIDVASVLPGQMGLGATMAIPLALVSSVIGTIGRMREDRELMALQATGIPPTASCMALLPLALLSGVLLLWLCHRVTPASMANWRSDVTGLMRLALSQKAQQQKPVYQTRGVMLAAASAEGSILKHVFGRGFINGRQVLGYARSAHWVSVPSEVGEDPGLRLQFDQVRLIQSGPAQDTLVYGYLPALVVDPPLPRAMPSYHPDVKPTAEVEVGLEIHERVLAALMEKSSSQRLLHEILIGSVSSVDQDQVDDWPSLLIKLRHPEHPLFPHLPPGLKDRILSGPADDALRSELVAWLNQDPSLLHRELPWPERWSPQLRQLAESAMNDPDLVVPLARLRLAGTLPIPVRGPSFDVLRLIGAQIADIPAPDSYKKAASKLRRSLREYQQAWHLRWMLPIAALAYWAGACALAMRLPSRGRLGMVVIGTFMVLTTIVPSLAVVEGLRGRLAFNPGWLLWTPMLLVGGAGLLFMRKTA